jgi:hypothetical protein
VLSKDPKFKTIGAKGAHSAAIIMRLSDLGVDLQGAKSAYLKKFRDHIVAKLPKDGRSLPELCNAFDPATMRNRAADGARKVKAALGLVDGSPARHAASTAVGAPPPDKRRKAVDAVKAQLEAQLRELQPGAVFTRRFGQRGQLEFLAPVVPGLQAGADVQLDRSRALMVTRSPDGLSYTVQTARGLGASLGLAGESVAGLLRGRVMAGGRDESGHRVTFDSLEDCSRYIAALVDPQDVDDAFDKATSIEAATRTELRAGASVTLSVDAMMAQLQAELAVGAESVRQVHKTASTEIEVSSRQVSVSAELRAVAAGELTSAALGAGIDVLASRTLARERGRFAANSYATFSVAVAERSLDTGLRALLPGLSEPRRAALRQQVGDRIEEGARLFVRCSLTSDARRQANASLGRAEKALTEALRAPEGSRGRAAGLEKARKHVKAAYAMTREPASYVAEGYGWMLRSTHEVEESRGLYADYAAGDDEQTRFQRFETADAAQVPSALMRLLP